MVGRQYPVVEGNRVVFNCSGSSVDVDEAWRPLRSLVLNDVSMEEYHWLRSEGRGWIVLDCDYQGWDRQGYDIVYNGRTRQVAIRWQGMTIRDVAEMPVVEMYDAISGEIERLRVLLHAHRRGEDGGWGDDAIAAIPVR
jgi:hypothetical protein